MRARWPFLAAVAGVQMLAGAQLAEVLSSSFPNRAKDEASATTCLMRTDSVLRDFSCRIRVLDYSRLLLERAPSFRFEDAATVGFPDRA